MVGDFRGKELGGGVGFDVFGVDQRREDEVEKEGPKAETSKAGTAT